MLQQQENIPNQSVQTGSPAQCCNILLTLLTNNIATCNTYIYMLHVLEVQGDMTGRLFQTNQHKSMVYEILAVNTTYNFRLIRKKQRSNKFLGNQAISSRHFCMLCRVFGIAYSSSYNVVYSTVHHVLYKLWHQKIIMCGASFFLCMSEMQILLKEPSYHAHLKVQTFFF